MRRVLIVRIDDRLRGGSGIRFVRFEQFPLVRIAVGVVEVGAQHDGDVPVQREKAAAELARLGEEVLLPLRMEVAEGEVLAADVAGRPPFGVKEDVREHTRRRRLAVTARHRDDVREGLCDLAEELRAREDGFPRPACLFGERRVHVHCLRTDDGLLINFLLADADGDALGAQPSHELPFARVASADGDAPFLQELRERAHAHAADADKVYPAPLQFPPNHTA